VLELVGRQVVIGGAWVLVLGFTFKENCPDLRNTKAIDVITALRSYGIEPVVVDPLADSQEAMQEYDLQVLPELPAGNRYAAVIAALSHSAFTAWGFERWPPRL